MKLQFSHKIYPGNSIRPQPEAQYYDTEQLFICSTPWAGTEASHYVQKTIKEYYSSGLADPEVTSPFAKLPGLSTSANNLRGACLLANNTIYQKMNKSQYLTSCELSALAFNNHELVWVNVGQPHLLLLRKNELHLLSSTLDLNFEFDVDSPLPASLLGLESQIDIEAKSILLQPKDLLILISRKNLPSKLFSLNLKNGKSANHHQEILFDTLVKDNSQSPFWMAVLEPGI